MTQTTRKHLESLRERDFISWCNCVFVRWTEIENHNGFSELGFRGDGKFIVTNTFEGQKSTAAFFNAHQAILHYKKLQE